MKRTLEFTSLSHCPVKCSFCPQDNLIAAQGPTLAGAPRSHLSIEFFERMLDKVPQNVEIHFSGFAEPLLNRRVPSMIREAKQRRFHVHLYTTLLGLDEAGANLLAHYSPDFIRIHVPDTKAFAVEPSVWIKKHLLWSGTGLVATYMTMGELPEAIQNHFAEMNALLPADIPKIKVDLPDMLSRAGSLWTPEGKPLSGQVECGAERWHSNVVLPDGRVFLCCMDYGLSAPLGNLMEEPYDHIYQRAEKMRLDETPENSICRKCEWARPKSVDTLTETSENPTNEEDAD